jgi:hypothetical protein
MHYGYNSGSAKAKSCGSYWFCFQKVIKYFLIFPVPKPNPEHFLMKAKIDPNRPDPAGELDCAWVIRWLDDIGLPQYKVPTRFLPYLLVFQIIA